MNDGPTSPELSIVIATHNHASEIDGCIQAILQESSDVEIIVVDGESEDGTIRAACSHPSAKIITAPECRGAQKNAGAKLAKGSLLLFINPSTRLDTGWYTEAAAMLKRDGYAAGAFLPAFRRKSFRLALVAFALGVRTCMFRMPFGDQGLFLRKTVFLQSGGFREWNRLEDIDLIRRLKKLGRLYISRIKSRNPAGKWVTDGLFKRGLFNLGILTLYRAGVSPQRLSQLFSDRDPKIGILSRYPGPGMSQEGLAAIIGRDAASDIHKELITATVQAVRATNTDFYIYHPREHQSYWFHQLLGPDTACRIHAKGNTGRQIECMFRDLVNASRPVIALHADSPYTDHSTIERALKLLKIHDAVIGSGDDGTVTLIGLKWLAPGLFDHIAWNTATTREQILKRLAVFNYQTVELPPLNRITNVMQLDQALKDPAVEPSLAERLRAIKANADAVNGGAAHVEAEPSLLA